MLNAFASDLRQSFRALLRSPGYAAVAVLTLGLGIGASTAIYTVLERVVLDPLPYPESERLVRLKSSVPAVGEGTEWDVSEGAWWFFKDEARTIDALGAYRRGAFNAQTPAGPQRLYAGAVTAETLRMLGARPAVGRVIDEADDDPGSAPVAVLSHGFWQRRFGGDPAVVGRTITLDDNPFEIVGVMEPGLELPPERGGGTLDTEVWVPLRLNPAGPFYNAHTQFRTIARLREGATLEAAQAEFERLNQRLPEVLPNVYSPGEFEGDARFRTVVYDLRAYAVGDVARNLWILFGAVALVLLIAAANVVNLFLVRVEARRRELAVRSALGASRGDVARQFFAESLVLAGAAATLALLLSMWGVQWLASLAPPSIPRMTALQPDGTVVAFAFGIAVLLAGLLALFPIARHGRLLGVAVLAEGARGATAGRERQRVRSALIVTQVALAMMLIVGAALLLESFRRVQAIDPGIEAEGVLTLEVALPYQRYPDTHAAWRFYDAALERVRALPGVSAAGVTSTLPFEGGFGCTVQGFDDPRVYERLRAAELTTCAGQEPTSPGYFEAMGIPVLRGRAFTDADNDNPERGVVVVSEAFAARFWPGEDPIGKGVGANGMTNQQFYRVIGVVGDVFASSPIDEPAVAIYYPIARIPETSGWSAGWMRMVVRTELENPASLVPQIQRAIGEVDPTIPVANAKPMDVLLAESTSRLSFLMVLLGSAAAVALLLAAIGLYGVLSYLVTRRTNEIGVRMALGARAEQVERLVVGGAVRLTAIGLLLGLGGAYASSRVLSSLLYGMEPTHAIAYATSAMLLAGVAALAAWLPARRAARIDPVEALRTE